MNFGVFWGYYRTQSECDTCLYIVPHSDHYMYVLEIDILGASKVDSDWLIGRTSARIGIVPITYLKDTNTTQILFCGEDFYENITELKQKEQIWILQEKNSQLQAQVVLLICRHAAAVFGPRFFLKIRSV